MMAVSCFSRMGDEGDSWHQLIWSFLYLPLQLQKGESVQEYHAPAYVFVVQMSCTPFPAVLMVKLEAWSRMWIPLHEVTSLLCVAEALRVGIPLPKLMNIDFTGAVVQSLEVSTWAVRSRLFLAGIFSSLLLGLVTGHIAVPFLVPGVLRLEGSFLISSLTPASPGQR